MLIDGFSRSLQLRDNVRYAFVEDLEPSYVGEETQDRLQLGTLMLHISDLRNVRARQSSVAGKIGMTTCSLCECGNLGPLADAELNLFLSVIERAFVPFQDFEAESIYEIQNG